MLYLLITVCIELNEVVLVCAVPFTTHAPGHNLEHLQYWQFDEKVFYVIYFISSISLTCFFETEYFIQLTEHHVPVTESSSAFFQYFFLNSLYI